MTKINLTEHEFIRKILDRQPGTAALRTAIAVLKEEGVEFKQPKVAPALGDTFTADTELRDCLAVRFGTGFVWIYRSDGDLFYSPTGCGATAPLSVEYVANRGGIIVSTGLVA